DVLEQDRSAVEDGIAREQRSLPLRLEQQREMAVAVSRGLDHLEREAPDVDAVPRADLADDGVRLENVVGGVEPGLLRDVEADGVLVAALEALPGRLRPVDDRMIESVAEAGQAPRVSGTAGGAHH